MSATERLNALCRHVRTESIPSSGYRRCLDECGTVIKRTGTCSAPDTTQWGNHSWQGHVLTGECVDPKGFVQYH
ncbi:hypothetical protein LCGC14_0429600 [marine sediment metagenome]|uniref:Uncharacterized protein n=1 Tax=marine sediment metagenome TaxID=412755 RepID=A0A0F9SUH7_9ZZZZ